MCPYWDDCRRLFSKYEVTCIDCAISRVVSRDYIYGGVHMFISRVVSRDYIYGSLHMFFSRDYIYRINYGVETFADCSHNKLYCVHIDR